MAVTVLVPGYGGRLRLVDPVYGWREGWWMDAGGALYESSLPLNRASRQRRSRGWGGKND